MHIYIRINLFAYVGICVYVRVYVYTLKKKNIPPTIGSHRGKHHLAMTGNANVWCHSNITVRTWTKKKKKNLQLLPMCCLQIFIVPMHKIHWFWFFSLIYPLHLENRIALDISSSELDISAHILCLLDSYEKHSSAQSFVFLQMSNDHFMWIIFTCQNDLWVLVKVRWQKNAERGNI